MTSPSADSNTFDRKDEDYDKSRKHHKSKKSKSSSSKHRREKYSSSSRSRRSYRSRSRSPSDSRSRSRSSRRKRHRSSRKHSHRRKSSSRSPKRTSTAPPRPKSNAAEILKELAKVQAAMPAMTAAGTLTAQQHQQLMLRGLLGDDADGDKAGANGPDVNPLGAGMIAVDPGTKMRRELFVGNTPPNTSEVALQQFLNQAMVKVKLNTMAGNPILQTRMSGKFAFVELRTIEETDNMLSLTGIPFNGAILRVGRPSKYTGPQTQSKTWHELTAEATEDGDGLSSDLSLLSAGFAAPDPLTIAERELFVGNSPANITDSELIDFLLRAMEQVDLIRDDLPGKPILNARISDKFAFVELRSIDEANAMLNLTGIRCRGQVMQIGRPAKYVGTEVPHRTWDEMLKMKNSGTIVGMNLPVPTRILRLNYMITAQELNDDEEYKEIGEDVEDECQKYGTFKSMVIPRPEEPVKELDLAAGVGYIYVEFSTPGGAAKAVCALQGRPFNKRPIAATFYSPAKYEARDFNEIGATGSAKDIPEPHATPVKPDAAKKASEFLEQMKSSASDPVASNSASVPAWMADRGLH